MEPLGGESCDILNRTRKFYNKSSRSKFHGSSLYSMYLNAKYALEYKRSNHDDYKESIQDIHASFIGSLICTSQITLDDWVNDSIQQPVNKNGKMYKYICCTGLWNESHVLYQVYFKENPCELINLD